MMTEHIKFNKHGVEQSNFINFDVSTEKKQSSLKCDVMKRKMSVIMKMKMKVDSPRRCNT